MKSNFKIFLGTELQPAAPVSKYQALASAAALSLRSRALVRVLDGAVPIQSFLFGKPQVVADAPAVLRALALDEIDSSAKPKSVATQKSAPRPVWAQRKPGAGHI